MLEPSVFKNFLEAEFGVSVINVCGGGGGDSQKHRTSPTGEASVRYPCEYKSPGSPESR